MHIPYKNIIIGGGASGMGLWFAKYLLEQRLVSFEQLYLYDTDAFVETHRSSLSAFQLLTPNHFTTSLGANDLLIIASPVDQVDNLCQTLLAKLANKPKKNNYSILNLCSVQNTTRNQIIEHLAPAAIIGVHFLFGPEITDRSNNSVVLVAPPSEQSHELFSYWHHHFSEKGFSAITTTPQDHDLMMQHAQVAIHFLYFGLTQYLTNNQVSLQSLMPYLTPIARAYLSSIAHTLLQTKKTYSNIQLQPGADRTRKEVLDALQETDRKLQHPEKKATDYLDQLAASFSTEDLIQLQRLFKQ